MCAFSRIVADSAAGLMAYLGMVHGLPMVIDMCFILWNVLSIWSK